MTPTGEISTRVSVSSVQQPYGICEFGFQGLMHEEETGNLLIYNRARVLHTQLMRFVQRDPLGYVDGMSMYAAYHVMWGDVDPSGMSRAPARAPARNNRGNRNGSNQRRVRETQRGRQVRQESQQLQQSPNGLPPWHPGARSGPSLQELLRQHGLPRPVPALEPDHPFYTPFPFNQSPGPRPNVATNTGYSLGPEFSFPPSSVAPQVGERSGEPLFNNCHDFPALLAEANIRPYPNLAPERAATDPHRYSCPSDALVNGVWRAVDYVLLRDGTIALGRGHNHIANDGPVLAAGQLNGDPSRAFFNNHSGHYRPNGVNRRLVECAALLAGFQNPSYRESATFHR